MKTLKSCVLGLTLMVGLLGLYTPTASAQVVVRVGDSHHYHQRHYHHHYHHHYR